MKNRKENMNTTLEIPEGSKATISGKNIDGKNYLVVEVENKSDMIDIEEKARIMLEKTRAEMNPEWTKFKRGDVLKFAHLSYPVIYVIFDEYEDGSNNTYFKCLFNSIHDGNSMWFSEQFRKATDKEKAKFFKWLRDEEGLEWDGEKLVEVLKEGDLAIFWDDNSGEARIAIYKRRDDDYGFYVDDGNLYWDNAIKWDGTKEQYEKVLRGEVK
jgi:hypothetical protein